MLGLVPGVTSQDRVAKILAKLQGTQVGPALLAASQSRSPKISARALDVLMLAGEDPAVRRFDEFLGDHGLTLGGPIGGGTESVVFEAIPRAGGDSQAVKVAVQEKMHSPRDAFSLPSVPGVLPYWARESMGPLAVGVQRRIPAIRGLAPYDAPIAETGVRRLENSLAARGWRWDDGHPANAGNMDGQWVVLDGQLTRLLPGERISSAAMDMQSSPEDAIRALRVLPEENHLFQK